MLFRSEEKIKLILRSPVMFDLASSELKPEAEPILSTILEPLKNTSNDIVVEGHTDSTGARDHNMMLSQARAQYVMNFLVSRGIPAEAISAIGIGPDRPIADNSTRDGRTENRRVEIIVKPVAHR